MRPITHSNGDSLVVSNFPPFGVDTTIEIISFVFLENFRKLWRRKESFFSMISRTKSDPVSMFLAGFQLLFSDSPIYYYNNFTITKLDNKLLRLRWLENEYFVSWVMTSLFLLCQHFYFYSVLLMQVVSSTSSFEMSLSPQPQTGWEPSPVRWHLFITTWKYRKNCQKIQKR